MRRIVVGLAVVVLILFYALSLDELASSAIAPRCTAAAFRPFAAKVWNAPWQRGAPKGSTIRVAQARIACAPPEQRGVMIRAWKRERRRYYTRRDHCLSGPAFSGRISEFSGGLTADGVHVATEPGIALRSYGTLGETFRLTTAAGTDYVKQIDWGPASWTGRSIDITIAQMNVMGWAPTDSWGTAKLIPGDCI